MRLQKLVITNFKGISEGLLTFSNGTNLIIGRNSSGKTSVIDAINFLLNPNAIQDVSRIIPYSQKKSAGRLIVSGTLNFGKDESFSLKTLLEDQKFSSTDPSSIDVVFTKVATFENGNIKNVSNNFEIKFQGKPSQDPRLNNFISNFVLQKSQGNSLVFFRPVETLNESTFIPTAQIDSMNINNPQLFGAYLKSAILKLKDEQVEKYQKLKDSIINSQNFISDFDVNFNIKIGAVELSIKYKNEDQSRPLSGEGLGIQEYVYLLTILMLFPDRTVIIDEGLIHMHHDLLMRFIDILDSIDYQLITTSHIKELIKVIDAGNIYISKVLDNKVAFQKAIELENLPLAFKELGYSND